MHFQNSACTLLQDESELRPHKLSFYVEKATAEQIVKDLSEKLKARGVSTCGPFEDYMPILLALPRLDILIINILLFWKFISPSLPWIHSFFFGNEIWRTSSERERTALVRLRNY